MNYLIFFADRLVLDFINQYWPYIYREVLPESRSVWEPIAVRDANKFLLHVPIKKILYFSDEVWAKQQRCDDVKMSNSMMRVV